MSAYLDIIFLLIVAVLIFARLRSVLGTRPENDKPEVRVVSRKEFEQACENMRREIEEKMNLASTMQKNQNIENAEGVDKVLYSIPHFDRADFCRRCGKCCDGRRR